MENRELLKRILSGDKKALEEIKRDQEKDISSIMAVGTKEQEDKGELALCIYYKGKPFENEKLETTSKEQLESYYKRAENVLIITKQYEKQEIAQEDSLRG